MGLAIRFARLNLTDRLFFAVVKLVKLYNRNRSS
jgi:hypothetical protein